MQPKVGYKKYIDHEQNKVNNMWLWELALNSH